MRRVRTDWVRALMSLEELRELDRDLRAQRAQSVYMEERVRLGVEIERLARELGAAIGRGET